MFESLKRALVPGLLMLGMSSCGDDSVVVWLHLSNVTPDVAALQVVIALDGKAAMQQYEFTQGLGEVAVKLKKSQLGQGQLVVNLSGINADRCKVSTGKYEAKASTDKPYEEVDVTLAVMSPAKCLLTVEKLGDGSVTSSPAGVSCGASCTMEVPVGTKVTLTSATATPFSGSFWEGCSGISDTCEVTVTKMQKVSVQWGPEVRPKLVKVPKGGFTMGSPTGEAGRNTDETQHSVTLTTDFWMAESEVTQRQYRNLMLSRPSIFKGDELPVELVSWLDAVEYCNELSVKEKLPPCYQISGTTVGWAEGVKCSGYRLPTEAEWEYAARSPATTVYAGSDSVDGVAWYSINSGSTTHAVKTMTANGRGLYDLSGNVWEWVWDEYQANYEALPSIDPIGPSTSANRVFRGGSWIFPAVSARVAQRKNFAPTYRSSVLGFRIVRSNP
jgi:formylglycine-generating enzyme required for sulfatase activity